MSRQFVFNWRVTLFAGVCLVVFVNLGFWQLNREAEKRDLLAERDLRLAAPPVAGGDISLEGDLHGLALRLSGQFLETLWLLDNRILDGRVGFEVLQLFEDDSGRSFVVNRGFVPMGRTRTDMPRIEPVNGEVTVTARIYQPADEPFLLATDMAVDAGLPIVQSLQDAQLAASISKGDSLYPFVVRLEEDAIGALPRHWPTTVMMPAQHRGYAIQWFTMAFAVAVVWSLFTWRKQSDGTES